MINDTRPEIFRGHLEECLEHLNKILAALSPHKKQRAKAIREAIAVFCGVVPESVGNWLQEKGHQPHGESFFKLICCLDRLGFRVIELENMRRVRRNFAELIGFSILTNEQASKLIGFSDRSSLFRILHGKSETGKMKLQLMFEIWKENKPRLDEKRDGALEDIFNELFNPRKKILGSPQTELTLEPERLSASYQPKAIIILMQGLLALFDSDKGSLIEKEITDLQTHSQTVSRLTTHLINLRSRLSSSDKPKEEVNDN